MRKWRRIDRHPAVVREELLRLHQIAGHEGDPQKTIDVFRTVHEANIADARRRGQLSHQLFIRLPMPEQSGPLEAIGLDLWADAAQGMNEHYASLSGYEAAFSAKPQTSVWEEPANGTWTEW